MIQFNYHDSLLRYARAISRGYGNRLDLEVACNQAQHEWLKKFRTTQNGDLENAGVQVDGREETVGRVLDVDVTGFCELPSLLKHILCCRIIDQGKKLPKEKLVQDERFWLYRADRHLQGSEVDDEQKTSRPNPKHQKERQAFEACFRRANFTTRQVVMRKFGAQEPSQKIAQDLGLTANAVDNRASRFKDRVRREYRRLSEQ